MISMLTQIAQILEDAADFILMRGLCRGELADYDTKQYCTIGAIYQVSPADEDNQPSVAGEACDVLERHLRAQGVPLPDLVEGMLTPVAAWSDNSSDDFEVIDALRHCAKDIRNSA